MDAKNLNKETNLEEVRKLLLSQSELSIWLDTYDDIFSDFDSRPLSERALSDDFISEAKKMAKEKPEGTISLKLLIPANQRNKETEQVIIKSLHSHFKKNARQLKAEMQGAKRKGVQLIVLGILIIVLGAYLVTFHSNNFLLNTLRVVLEPAGWFFTWTGFDNFFYQSGNKEPEHDFASRMSHAEITFLTF